ncbi:DUF6207 family protein [Streptomyces umbrinus]|uniref:DUF6207 family protein n=1 Tax=Streptomyces umbrinus TaxID=67370 RepID=UPI0033F4A12C
MVEVAAADDDAALAVQKLLATRWANATGPHAPHHQAGPPPNRSNPTRTSPPPGGSSPHTRRSPRAQTAGPGAPRASPTAK